MLADRARLVGTGRVAGQLFDFGRYPGAVSSRQPDHWVQGEVHELDSQLLALLDEYEGSDFERAVAPARMPERTMDCWIYWYVGSEAGRLIASGDWFDR
jgi:gamma-glutamylcyclotransferase (GGCT)/AIG2-like uncharacterized protein YtfP